MVEHGLMVQEFPIEELYTDSLLPSECKEQAYLLESGLIVQEFPIEDWYTDSLLPSR